MFHEESFINHLEFERRCSPFTVMGYAQDLTHFIKFCTENQCLTSAVEVRHLHVRAWIVALMESGRMAQTVNRKLSCLKTYFKYLKRRGLIERDPMQKVMKPKAGKRLPVYVQENQLEMLFSHVHFGTDFKGQRDRMILEILYSSGMRRSELHNLKISDVDLGSLQFKIMGKGGKERLVPFARPLAQLIEQYLRSRREQFPTAPERWFFLDHKTGDKMSLNTIYTTVRKYLSLVTTVEQRSPHVLRHSFATHLSNNGADLNAIKTLLGHASLAATQIYTHNSIEKLKKVYEQAHPKSKIDEGL